MNTETFFQQFELLADAPNGIAKLRELILQLAVQGKLVPQNPDDEPADVLLERIKAEKERLVKERKIRNTKTDSNINIDVLIELPDKWALCQIGDFAIIQGGKRLPKGTTFSKTVTPHIYIRVTNMKNGTLIKDNLKYIDSEIYNAIEKYIIEKEDIYVTIAGTIGEVGEVPDFFNKMNLTENAAKIVFRELDKTYLILALNSNFVQKQFTEKTNQQAQSKLALKRIANTLIPLPPLAEQHRIVEKVNRLMELCDKLETQQQQQHTKTLQLATVATSRLTSAKTPEAFKQHWQNISKNFDLIYSTPENIKQLRQTILQLAVMGKLVPQNPDDEPASVLLAKIKAEKEKLIKEGKIKKSKKLKAIASDEMPFDLPNSWIFTNIGELAQSLRYGTSKKCNYEVEGNPVLRIPNLLDGGIDTSDLKFAGLSESELNELKVLKDDLLMIRSNGSKSLVGRTSVLREDLDNYAYAGYLVRIRLLRKYISSIYLHLVLESKYIRDQIEIPVRTTTGVKNINSTEISNLVIPLPPLAEQHRIVAKVNQLMTYCDELEAKLTQSLSDKEKLMDTAVYQLLTA